MESLIFKVLAIIITLNLLVGAPFKRFTWFIAGILFFPFTIIISESPYLDFQQLLIYIFTLSTLFSLSKDDGFKSRFRSFPLKKILTINLILLLLIGLFDSRLPMSSRILRPVSSFLERFFPIVYGFLYIKTELEYKKVMRAIVIFGILFGIYGIINYLTKENQYNDIISSTFSIRNFSQENMDGGVGRFRISSFAWHPIYYGMLLIFFIGFGMIEQFLLKRDKKSYNMPSLMIGLTAINLVLVNSRTPLLALGFYLIIFFLFGLSFKEKFTGVLAISFIAIAAFFAIPAVATLISQTADTFTSKGSEIDGSSLEMREGQLLSSAGIYAQSPIVGNGFRFINEGLGYSSDSTQSSSDSEFAGFESYLFELLIEQGICGILASIFFFAGLIRLFSKKFKNNSLRSRKVSVIGNSLIVAYLIFILGTGVLGSFLIFSTLIGIQGKGFFLFNIRNAKEV